MDESLIDTQSNGLFSIMRTAERVYRMPYMTHDTHNRSDIGSRRTRKKTRNEKSSTTNIVCFFYRKKTEHREREWKQNVPGRAPNTHSRRFVIVRHSENPYSWEHIGISFGAYFYQNKHLPPPLPSPPPLSAPPPSPSTAVIAWPIILNRKKILIRYFQLKCFFFSSIITPCIRPDKN